ncbi:unnamed protein product [Chrysodeixis includens]|uniref:Speckle targeted PIP5K1A-regulated poly(A) polymerase n=1 Tax=Chrysodeixis includens TaxID=689277 RepID=A0A9N8L2P1_CHRIL|nr:unnamed protein product [Chrysodeixis includens]
MFKCVSLRRPAAPVGMEGRTGRAAGAGAGGGAQGTGGGAQGAGGGAQGVGGGAPAAGKRSSPRHNPRRRDREPPDMHPNTPPQRRILVSGFPGYAQAHDLLEVFRRFGNVRVDKMCAWACVLSFPAEREALAAASARPAHVYGHFLHVRPYSPAALDLLRPKPPTPPKRDFPMSKQKGVIIDPRKLELSGDFLCQLDKILSAVRLTQENVKALGQLYTDLENVLQVLWPGCKAVPFGSITTGLGIKTSDADCFINIPGQYRQPNGNYVNKAKRVLMQHPESFAEILAIPRANTPIVKFFHIPTNTNCDVTFKTPLGAQNSRLVAFLLHSDPRLLPVSVIIKYWAKVHDLSGTGKLTNYALTLMIVFYLQQLAEPLLPSVEWLQAGAGQAGGGAGAGRVLVDGWDTGFPPDAALPPRANSDSIAQLLGGFFQYYADFNFDELVICPYFGAPVKKDIFRDTASMPNEFQRYKTNVLNNYVLPLRYQTAFCVQDPFEQCHNVASTITNRLAADLKCFFAFAADAYEKDKDHGCENFLPTILIEKPKLLRGKTHPEYRVNLFPRLLNTIVESEWKTVVRDLVRDIFENLFKIKLNLLEETVNPDTKKEKEKYTALLNKAIWKRKSFAKLYSIVDMNFIERQAKITEEIIVAEKHDLGIQFMLILTFCNDPKSACVAVRMGSGDVFVFREFGKFFMSTWQTWFTQMLKQYLISHCRSGSVADSMELDNNDVEVESDYDDEDIHNSKSESPGYEPVRRNTETDKAKSGEAMSSTLTNHAGEDAETLPSNSDRTSTDATLIKSADALIRAININGSPTPEVSEVAVACAQK